MVVNLYINGIKDLSVGYVLSSVCFVVIILLLD